MKKKILFFLFFLIFLADNVTATTVFSDNFADCDYANNPTWTVTGGTWTVNQCMWLYKGGSEEKAIYSMLPQSLISTIGTTWTFLYQGNGSESGSSPRTQFELINASAITPETTGQFNCVAGKGGYALDIENGVNDYALLKCGKTGVYTNLLGGYQAYTFNANTVYNLTLVRNSTHWVIYLNNSILKTAADTEDQLIDRVVLFAGVSSNGVLWTNILGVNSTQPFITIALSSPTNTTYTSSNPNITFTPSGTSTNGYSCVWVLNNYVKKVSNITVNNNTQYTDVVLGNIFGVNGTHSLRLECLGSDLFNSQEIVYTVSITGGGVCEGIDYGVNINLLSNNNKVWLMRLR